MLKRSSKKTHARGGKVFSFRQYRALMTQGHRVDIKGHASYLHFAEFLQYRFVAMSFLLGALRSIQFDRFRKAGMVGCRDDKHGKDCDGLWRPTATIDYIRAQALV